MLTLTSFDCVHVLTRYTYLYSLYQTVDFHQDEDHHRRRWHLRARDVPLPQEDAAEPTGTARTARDQDLRGAPAQSDYRDYHDNDDRRNAADANVDGSVRVCVVRGVHRRCGSRGVAERDAGAARSGRIDPRCGAGARVRVRELCVHGGERVGFGDE